MTNEPAGVDIDGGRLRQLRKINGYDLKAFAEIVDISFGYLGQLEREEGRRVSPATFVRICDALRIGEGERHQMIRRAAA